MDNIKLEDKYDQLVSMVHKIELQIQSLIDNQRFLGEKLCELTKDVGALVKIDSELLVLKKRIDGTEEKVIKIHDKLKEIEKEQIEKAATKKLVWWQISIICAAIGAGLEAVLHLIK